MPARASAKDTIIIDGLAPLRICLELEKSDVWSDLMMNMRQRITRDAESVYAAKMEDARISAQACGGREVGGGEVEFRAGCL